MTWRRFGVLLRGLPQESRYQTVLRDTLEVGESDDDGEQRFGPWGVHNYQLAALIDATRDLAAAFGGGEPPARVPVPVMKRRAKPIGVAGIAYLQDIRDRHRREAGQ